MTEIRFEDTYASMATNIESIQEDNQLENSLQAKCSNTTIKWSDLSNFGHLPVKLIRSKRKISSIEHIKGDTRKHFKSIHNQPDTLLPLTEAITSEFPSQNKKTKNHGEADLLNTLYWDAVRKRPHRNLAVCLRQITTGVPIDAEMNSRLTSKSDESGKKINKRTKTKGTLFQSELLPKDMSSTDNADTSISRRSKRSNAAKGQTSRYRKFHENNTESTGCPLGQRTNTKISKSRRCIKKLSSDVKPEQFSAPGNQHINETALSNVTVVRRTSRLHSRRNLLMSNAYKSFADISLHNIVKSSGKKQMGSQNDKTIQTRMGLERHKNSSKIHEVLANCNSADQHIQRNAETIDNENKSSTYFPQTYEFIEGNIRNPVESPDLIIQMRHCRQIKPTPKLLSNKKLRCNLESRNNTRFVEINTQFSEDNVKEKYPNDFFTTRANDYSPFCSISSPIKINIDSKNYKGMSEFTELSDKCEYLSLFGLKRNIIDDSRSYKEKESLIPLKKAKQHRNCCEPNRQDFFASYSSLEDMSMHKLEVRNNLQNKNHPTGESGEHTSCLNVLRSQQINNLMKKFFTKCLCEGETTQYFVKRDAKTCCDALDHINGTLVGCLNEIRDQIFVKLFRPSYRIQYMIFCQDHTQRLKLHKCCSYCGIFCTQGKFMLCNSQHTFHFSCARLFNRTNQSEKQQKNLVCPHCECSEISEIYITSMKCRKVPVLAIVDNSTTTKIDRINICDDQKILGKSLIYFLNTQKTPQQNMEIVASHLLNVVSDNDIGTAMEIISTGYDITSKLVEFNGGSVLHGVAHQGDSTMARLLLCTMPCTEFINAFDNDGKTPLMCSVVSEAVETLQVLIEFGADINIRNAAGMTCLHFAAKDGNSAAVKYILNIYKNKYCGTELKNFISQKDKNGYSALLWAKNCKNSATARMMVEYVTKESKLNGISNVLKKRVCLSNRNMTNLIPNENKKIAVRSQLVDKPLHLVNSHSNNNPGIFLVNANNMMPHDINKQHLLDCVRLRKLKAKQNYCNMKHPSRSRFIGNTILR